MATQEIICERVNHIPVMGVESIEGVDITPKDGYAVTLLRTQFAKVTRNTEASGSGALIKEELEIIIPSLPDKELKNLQNAHQVFVLSTSKGRTILFGSMESPARFIKENSQMDPVRLIFSVTRI